MKEQSERLKIIPLGGLEQVGLNITAFEYGDTIVVVDCGMAFPEDVMLGVDLVIPDVSYLKENRDKVKGFVITHGHEDHIGGLSYVIPELNVPIYATKLTMGIIENKFEEKGLIKETKRHIVKFGQNVNFGDIKVEFIKTNHSIQDAAALAIHTPAGIVVHTGDFKVDYTPVHGDQINLQRFAALGKKGVLALLSDSTNAERRGFTMSERTVGATIDQLFQEHSSSRIIVATFASNVDRVQQIMDSAKKFGRKVMLEGRSMCNIIGTAIELGYIDVPLDTIIEIDQLKNYPPEKVVIISTGSQGESMAALSRMAQGIHKKISIMPTDTIILSSNPIPGNEKAVNKIINDLYAKGAEVIFQDVHVSGHACEEELKLIYSLLNPKYAVPIHGELRHRRANANIAMSLGIPKENIFILKSGDVLEMNGTGAEVTDRVQTDMVLVDGLGVGDVGNAVLRDRQHLGEAGIFIIAMTVDREFGQILAGPEIESKGFVYVKESEELLDEARQIAYEAALKCLNKNYDIPHFRNVVKDSVNNYIWRKTKRRPVILPIIMEL
ncbi:MAG: ribonuclease J [Clostridiales bacterium]|nr:ribonuclease J [Clostridiales bacterium]